MQRNHNRASGMSQTSIAVPTIILAQLTRISLAEKRSRNNVIEVLLSEGIKRYGETGDLIARRGRNGRQ